MIRKDTEQVIPPELKALELQIEQLPQTPFSAWKRLSVRLEKRPLLDWLRAQTQTFKFCWKNRSGQDFRLGWGIAQEFHARSYPSLQALFSELQTTLQSAPEDLRAFGGTAFPISKNSNFPPHPAWDEMETSRWVIPRFEITRKAQNFYLNLNFYDQNQASRHEIIKLIQAVQPPSPDSELPLPDLQLLKHQPDQREWSQQVAEMLKHFSEHKLDKAVLARVSHFQASTALSGIRLLKLLLEAELPAYLYYFEWPQGTIFAGLSPERLYQRKGVSLRTEALAGTRRSSLDQTLHHRLENELLGSDKDRLEHRMVTDFLNRVLKPFSTQSPEVEPLRLIQSGPVQHLYQPIQAQLKVLPNDADLIEALHPTPAVAGLPRPAALEALEKTQALFRGWYSSPVGWMNASQTEFAVALRCVLVQSDQLRFYTGAGIVKGSVAEAEWEELNAKLETLLRLFKEHPPERISPRAWLSPCAGQC